MMKTLALSSLFLLSAIAIKPVSAAEPIIDLTAIDSSIDPCDNFYQYACGAWIKRFELPSDRTIFNRQTDGLTEDSIKNLNSLLETFAQGKNPMNARYARELGALYSSCINTSAIEASTPGFLQGQFAEIDSGLANSKLADLIAYLQLEGVPALFNAAPAPDLSDSNQTIAQLDQGGMSFPDRHYYFDQDAKSIEIRGRFITHVSKMLVLAGESAGDAAQDAKLILAFETDLAQNALATEDMQDSTQLHHPTDLKGLMALAPAFDWAEFNRSLGISGEGTMNVSHPEFLQGMSALLSQERTDALRAYLKWHVVHSFASALSQAIGDEDFDFWSKYLAGQKERPTRQKECTEIVKNTLSDALGEAFVKSISDPEKIRTTAKTMIEQIKAAFGSNLDSLDWLDDPTRTAAKLKLSKVKDKVAFPDHWRSFDGLVLNGDLTTNLQAAIRYASARELAKINRPTDRSFWDMPPWEQNAYYTPQGNEMVFPLGALVPPILDLTATLGANFGSIGGGWMGHELSHGFDSDGHHYDGDGNLVNWWTDQTEKEFASRTQCLVDQASQYEVLPGLKVRGKQTLTENMADQGGVKVGFLAFLKASQEHGPGQNVGPFNERQQYWLAYAQSYCTKQTPEQLRLQVTSDVHPPAEFRTNGVLFNRPEFAEDFGCRAGNRMAPVNRCGVW